MTLEEARALEEGQRVKAALEIVYVASRVTVEKGALGTVARVVLPGALFRVRWDRYRETTIQTSYESLECAS